MIQTRKKHQTPPLSFGGDWGSYTPIPVQEEFHPNKVQPKHPLSIRILKNRIPKSMEKQLKLVDSDRKRDCNEHVELVDAQLSYFSVDDSSKCKLFTLTLVGPTLLWFNDLPMDALVPG